MLFDRQIDIQSGAVTARSRRRYCADDDDVDIFKELHCACLVKASNYYMYVLFFCLLAAYLSLIAAESARIGSCQYVSQ